MIGMYDWSTGIKWFTNNCLDDFRKRKGKNLFGEVFYEIFKLLVY